MGHDSIGSAEKPREGFEDALSEICRRGAQRMLAEALEAEVEAFIEEYANVRDLHGRRQVVRNGYLPEREIQTGVGAIEIRQPRVRAKGGEVRFSSAILPPYLRRSRSLEELIPWLYLRGISTGEFPEALAALLGPDAPGLSPATISRLKAVWQEDYERWNQRDLSAKRYVYFWVDGVYLSTRMDHDQCILVVIAADEQGNKELIGLRDGYRESEQSWRELLLDLKHRGLAIAPELATGDGALGFWKALPQVYGKTRRQRCWVHKTANVLNKLPKSVQPRAKADLQAIWMAETRKQADKAFNYFLDAYGAKYPKAAECLAKDRDDLLAFYDFPAEHWIHIRTTNPIESTFATVRLRTYKTKGCLSRDTALTLVFQLVLSAQKRWRRLNGSNKLAELIEGIEFNDGIRVLSDAA